MLIDEIEAVLGGIFPYTLTTDLRFVLAFSFVVAAVATRIVMPRLIRKLDGAGIVGVDINKPDPKPEIPEMGGLGWLLGLYSGVFAACPAASTGSDWGRGRHPDERATPTSSPRLLLSHDAVRQESDP